MSLFRSTLRPPAILSDEAAERSLEALRSEVEPDPLFRRRLRGEIVNRYVATREGAAEPRPLPRRMGRLGRAVLYASFLLGLTVSSVMAASQEALPGDALYLLKRQIETLRAQVAPAHLQPDLAAYVLAERISELGALAERGAWTEVVSLAAEVERDYEAFVALQPAADAAVTAPYLDVLNGLLERLPTTGRTAVADVLAGLPGIDQSSGGAATVPSRGASSDGTGDNEAARNDGTTGGGTGPAAPPGPSNGIGPGGGRTNGSAPVHLAVPGDVSTPPLATPTPTPAGSNHPPDGGSGGGSIEPPAAQRTPRPTPGAGGGASPTSGSSAGD